MLNRPSLLIFVDGLPFGYIDNIVNGNKWSVKKSVTPGLGYSANIKAEIFAGMNPDKAGYFNEWRYSDQGKYRKLSPLLYISSLVSPVYLLDRIAHRVWSKILGRNLLNIPFKYLPLLEPIDLNIYSRSYRLPTIFQKTPKLRVIDHNDYYANHMRDQKMIDEAERLISGGISHLYISLVDLDHISHVYGPESNEHIERIEFLSMSINSLAEKFQTKHSDGIVAVFSDHGMAKVIDSIEINLENEFGQCNETSYLYFKDSTMLRVWCFNTDIDNEIEHFLARRTDGMLLSETQRQYYGVTNPDYGTHIFILNEGLVFQPGFFGRKTPKGMHGYLPEISSQQGILLIKGDPTVSNGVQFSRDLWKMFSKI